MFSEGLAQRHHGLTVLSVQDLTHSAVDGGQAAEDALEAGHGLDCVDTGEVTQSQQEEQNGQAAENNLGSLVMLQSADEHKCGEDAPQQQVVAHSDLAGSSDAGFCEGIDPDENQRPPEQAVSGECSAGEGVALAQFTDTGDDLSQAAQSDTHGDDGDGEGQKTCVMQIQQNGGHAKAQQTQRAGVGYLGSDGRH